MHIGSIGTVTLVKKETIDEKIVFRQFLLNEKREGRSIIIDHFDYLLPISDNDNCGTDPIQPTMFQHNLFDLLKHIGRDRFITIHGGYGSTFAYGESKSGELKHRASGVEIDDTKRIWKEKIRSFLQEWWSMLFNLLSVSHSSRSTEMWTCCRYPSICTCPTKTTACDDHFFCKFTDWLAVDSFSSSRFYLGTISIPLWDDWSLSRRIPCSHSSQTVLLPEHQYLW